MGSFSSSFFGKTMLKLVLCLLCGLDCAAPSQPPLSPPTCQMAQGCTEISGALKTEDKASVCIKRKKKMWDVPPCPPPTQPNPTTAAGRARICTAQPRCRIYRVCSHNALHPSEGGGHKSESIFFVNPHPPFFFSYFANGILQ